MSVRLCVRPRCARHRSRLGDTVRPPSLPGLSGPFYSLFPSSLAQLDSDAAEQLDGDVRGSAFPTILVNGGGKKKKITGAHRASQHPAPPQPAASQHPTHQPVEPSKLFLASSFSSRGKERVTALLGKV